MSKDKHKGVERRKFALANAGRVIDTGRARNSMLVRDFPLDTRSPDYFSRFGRLRIYWGRSAGSVNISPEVRSLLKQRKLKRVRRGLRRCKRTYFKPTDDI